MLSVASSLAFAALPLLVAQPLFAQDAGAGSDFSTDVTQGQQDIATDPVAQEQQLLVVDGEDQSAGDESSDSIGEFATEQDAQAADNNGDNNNGDFTTSDIADTADGDNITAQSQDIIDVQEEVTMPGDENDNADQSQGDQNGDQQPVDLPIDQPSSDTSAPADTGSTQ